MLNGKNQVKGLYKDNTLVATWDRLMDPSDLTKAIANHVKEDTLTEVDSDVTNVQSFPEFLVQPEVAKEVATPEPVVVPEPAPAPPVAAPEPAKAVAKAGPKAKAKAKK